MKSRSMNFSNIRRDIAPLACIVVLACSEGSPTDSGNRDSTGPLVASATPLPNATGVAIGTTITVTFSEPVDPAAVTTNTFTITGPAGPVAGSVAVAGAVATFTPTDPLTELASSYTARVTAGVRDLAGNALAAEHSWQFVTEMVSPLYWYRLSNMLLGDDYALDTYNNPDDGCFMNVTGNTSGQRWKFTANARGAYRLTNLFRGPTMALEGGDGSARCSLDPEGDFSGQDWDIVASPLNPGYHRLQTRWQGAGRSLDVMGASNIPYLAVTGDFSGQLWKVRRGAALAQ